MDLNKLKLFRPKTGKPVPKAMPAKGFTLVIGNSYTKLLGYSEDEYLIVQDLLTYDNQEVIYNIQQLKVQLGFSFRYKKFNKVAWLKKRIAELETQVKICWLKESSFPTGHLTLVTDELKAKGVKFVTQDSRVTSKHRIRFPWNAPDLRYFQREMVALGVPACRGVFESAVGSGKTLTAQRLIFELGVSSLVILPSKDLSIQTYDSFKEVFGADYVQLVSAGAKFGERKPIKLCTVQTLAAMLKKGTLKDFLKGIDLVCVDEVHHAGAATYSKLLPYFDHIYYRFGFSGTFMRNDSKTLDMWGFLSTVLYRYSAAQATKEGFLTPLKVVAHPVRGQRAFSYQSEYSKNYCDNPELLNKIRWLIEDYIPSGDQILILVGRKEKSGGILHKYLAKLGIHSDYVSGDDTDEHVKTCLRKFNAKETQILIGSSIIGEGIDVRSTDHLIMCQGGKSEIQITQAIGRAVRLYPGKKVAYVHDFKFEGTKYLESHLEKRLDIYTKNFDGELECIE